MPVKDVLYTFVIHINELCLLLENIKLAICEKITTFDLI